jgi:DNA-binding HxlR family transcriptional regulator
MKTEQSRETGRRADTPGTQGAGQPAAPRLGTRDAAGSSGADRDGEAGPGDGDGTDGQEIDAQEMDAAPAGGAAKGPLFCPVGRALDLIGERWTLVLVRHLLGGPRGCQELRTRTGIAPRVLSTRLRQLAERGFVQSVTAGSRSQYALTAYGESLEPIVQEIARWWVLHEMEQMGPFRDTTPASVVEALPFMVNRERARGVTCTYELRLTGEAGGVWTVAIQDGTCRVREGFADHADVRYTVDARDWCRMALNRMDDREAFRAGRLKKDGEGRSLAWYFHRPMPLHPPAAGSDDAGG